MNKTCLVQGHQWRQDYPAEESEWIHEPLRIFVCTRCGKTKSEGQHTRLKSELTGQVHDKHVEMVRASAEIHGI